MALPGVKGLNKNHPEAETRKGSYMTGFMSSEFLRILKNSYILIRILQWHKNCMIFKQEFQLKTVLVKSKEFFRILVLKNGINVCKVCTVYKNIFKNLAGWNLE